MATIYLVDTNQDGIMIRKESSHGMAVARARGLLFCREENAGSKEDQLKEYWSYENNIWLYNLKYEGSRFYCVVTNK